MVCSIERHIRQNQRNCIKVEFPKGLLPDISILYTFIFIRCWDCNQIALELQAVKVCECDATFCFDEACEGEDISLRCGEYELEIYDDQQSLISKQKIIVGK